MNSLPREGKTTYLRRGIQNGEVYFDGARTKINISKPREDSGRLLRVTITNDGYEKSSDYAVDHLADIIPHLRSNRH